MCSEGLTMNDNIVIRLKMAVFFLNTLYPSELLTNFWQFKSRRQARFKMTKANVILCTLKLKKMQFRYNTKIPRILSLFGNALHI